MLTVFSVLWVSFSVFTSWLGVRKGIQHAKEWLCIYTQRFSFVSLAKRRVAAEKKACCVRECVLWSIWLVMHICQYFVRWLTSVVYLDEKAMSGYSSSHVPAMMVRDHSGWHSAGHSSSKPDSYGASMPSVSHWSSRSPAAVAARSNWSGRSRTSAVGVGSCFVSSCVTSLRTPVEARYGAYKSMTNFAVCWY